MMKNIIIGCDNAAFTLKNVVIDYLNQMGVEVEDIGCFTIEDNTMYPYIAKKVCEKVIESHFEKDGILICGTGIGMAMTANKFKGIRAAVCHDIYSAERAKLSNNSNILCMGERVIGQELAKKIVKEWMSLSFVDGSSTPKVEAIKEVETENLK